MPERNRRPRPLNRLRIVQLATSDVSFQYLLRPQLDALRAAGHEVLLASAPGSSADRLQRDGYDFYALQHATPSWDLPRDARLQIEIYKLFKKLRPDVVHTHIHKTGVLGRLAARAARVPRIINTHHGFYARPEDGLARKAPVYALERLAAACSDLELVQNPEDLAVLRRLGVPPSRLVLLGNGVDLRRFRPASVAERTEARASLGVGDAVLVVGVGRIIAEKGWREFASAIRGVPGAKGILAGPLQPMKAKGLTPRELLPVSYLGMVDEPERLYWAADIAVVPSWGREGLPRAAIEASACGIPVVGADARGVRQVIQNGVTGMLHPIGDSAKLREQLMKLAASVELRVQMGTAARQRAVAYFDEDAVVERVVAAIEGRPVKAASIGAMP